MKIHKHTTNGLTYFQCEPIQGIQLFAFTKRALVIDLFKIYGYSLFNTLNLN